jgi:hypothetical protein
LTKLELTSKDLVQENNLNEIKEDVNNKNIIQIEIPSLTNLDKEKGECLKRKREEEEFEKSKKRKIDY